MTPYYFCTGFNLAEIQIYTFKNHFSKSLLHTYIYKKKHFNELHFFIYKIIYSSTLSPHNFS